MEFAELEDGALKLTAAGHVFARAGTDERKRLFREHLLRFVPLTAHICRVLREREGRRAPRLRFEVELEDHLIRRDAEQTLRAVTAWGRYAELFAYDDKTRTFSTVAAAVSHYPALSCRSDGRLAILDSSAIRTAEQLGFLFGEKQHDGLPLGVVDLALEQALVMFDIQPSYGPVHRTCSSICFSLA